MEYTPQVQGHVLIIIGHPREGSFCHGIAEQYKSALDKSCFEVKTLDLEKIAFVADVDTPSPNAIELEPCLSDAQKLIRWADHLVFVYPNWWGTFPAKLKAFFDRVFTPEFAFYEDDEPGVYQPLLKGKTAEVFVTMDTPPFVYEHLLSKPGHRAISNCILSFCGIKPCHVTSFGIVKGATEQQRQQWLAKVSRRAQQLSSWKVNAAKHVKRMAWLKLLRLQFYPMSLMAFIIGTLAAIAETDFFSWPVFIFGYLTLFCFKAATVFANEIYDYDTDVRNTNYSPFNGGSRVLVDKDISLDEARRAIKYVLCAAAVFGVFIAIFSQHASFLDLLVLLGIALVTTLGYTSPPFKWVYQGFGEVIVGFTHSFLVVLSAYVIQTGEWFNTLPWLLSLPLCFAILPAIILSAIPDYDADKVASKRTLPVQLGTASAVKVAMYSVIATVVLTLLSWPWLLETVIAYVLIAFMLWHAWRLYDKLQGFHLQQAPVQRINGLMVYALSFIMWPSVVALVDLSLR